MRSNDWQPMDTAPLNPYGKPWGPNVLVWCVTDNKAWTAYFDPWFGWETRDCGPAWVIADGAGDNALGPEEVKAWMPLAAPWPDEAPDAALTTP